MNRPKYAPLIDYLQRLPSSHQRLVLTSPEIEEIIRVRLPKSAWLYQA